MRLDFLSDDTFENSFCETVKSERKIMHIVVKHVQEASRRKYYLARGYGSLQDYLIKKMKYSEPAAGRRIKAANLVTEIPKIAEQLEDGSLNLSQIGKLCSAVRQAEQIHEEKISTEKKEELIGKMLGLNGPATEQLCAKELDIPVIEPQKISTQKDNSKRVQMTLTEEQYKKYEEVRNKLAHKNFQKCRSQNMADVLETAFDEILKMDDVKIASVKKASVRKKEVESPTSGESKNKREWNKVKDEVIAEESKVNFSAHEPKKDTKFAASVSQKDESDQQLLLSEDSTQRATVAEVEELNSETWNSLTPKRKKIILNRDGCCQYRDHKTGKACGSRFNLHVDHIQPKWAGGSNHPSNLRALCREHNLFRERSARH